MYNNQFFKQAKDPQSQFNSGEANYPPLPDRLDKLIDEPWTPGASAALDRWGWYVDQEWLGVVR